jgi:hypothetical protein
MFKLSRLLIAYAIAVPLALILGYLVSSPDSFSFAAIAMILFFLALPLILKWHHALLIIFWNSAFNAFFLPGQPHFWVVMAALSFGISFINHVVFQKPWLRATGLTFPLLLLAVVVLFTALCRGGIGIRALGGTSYGGRYYVYVLGAILGFFGLAAVPVPIAKGRKLADWFFLSGTTYALSNLVFVFGPAFYFLYYLVPSDYAMGQAASEFGMADVDRLTGLAPASFAALCFLLTHYGIRGLLEWTKPWRVLFLLIIVGGCFFAGFRSAIVMLFLIFAFQFYFEGLHRTHLLPIVIAMAICGMAPILVFANKMPNAVQRAISFLPVNVDSEILSEAKGSSEFRFQMWAIVWEDVPKYLLIGKGYSIDPTQLALTTEAVRTGLLDDFESSLLAEDYHSGPLSVLVPFGIFGAVAFLWILIAGFRILHANYRYGDARLRRINGVLLSYYLSYCISFFFIYGALNSDLAIFLGVCGMSVSLNGGVRKKETRKRKLIRTTQTLAMQAG